MADAREDPEIRATIDELERELRDAIENQVIGAVESGAALISTQEQVDRFYERLNAEPLETRLRHLVFVMGEEWNEVGEAVRASIADVTYAAEVAPAEDDPSMFVMTIKPSISFRRSAEQVFFTVSVAPSDPYVEALVKCGRDRAAAERDVAYQRAHGLLTEREGCRVYWGSHGCSLERGHDGDCECDCCDCAEHPDADSGCVAKPPYYGERTVFSGEDAAARGLNTHVVDALSEERLAAARETLMAAFVLYARGEAAGARYGDPAFAMSEAKRHLTALTFGLHGQDAYARALAAET